MRRLIAALSVATALTLSALGAVPAAAQPVQDNNATSTDSVVAAAACRDVTPSFVKPAGQKATSGTFITTSNCNDIQIKVPQFVFVKVCFVGSSITCQESFKNTVANEWVDVATNVRDNTRFYFLFSDDRAVGGLYAA